MRIFVVIAMCLAAGAASAATAVQGQLLVDTTWTLEQSPYQLTGDVVVPPDVTLTIEPGVTVIAANTDGQNEGSDPQRVELISRGTLRVRGTDSSPVTFQGATAAASSWCGVRVEGGTTSTLTGALIRDATDALTVSHPGTSVTVSSSTLTANGRGVFVTANGALFMDHTFIRDNVSEGVYLDQGSATLRFLTIASNGYMGIYFSSKSDTRLSLRDSIVISNGRYGFFRKNFDGTVSLSHNNFWNNTDGDYANEFPGAASISANPLFVSASNLRLTSFSPGRRAASDGVSDLGVLPYTGDPAPFLAGFLVEDTTLSGSHTLSGDLVVPAGITLTLAPGTTLTAMPGDALKAHADPGRAELFVLGTLRVQGTDASPVTLRGANASPGTWYGVRVETYASASLSGAVIRDAVQGVTVSGPQTYATVSGSTLSHNNFGAVVFSDGALSMDHSLVHANTSDGINVDVGTATLSHVTLANNKRRGISHSGNRNARVILSDSIVTGGNVGLYRGGASGLGQITLSANDVWGNFINYSSVSAEPRSFSRDPLYVSATDFHLQTDSPCRGAGSHGTDLGAFASETPTVTHVEVTPASATMPAAGTTAFTAAAYDAAGNRVRGAVLTWSADASAGTINAQGVFTASCALGTVAAAVTATSLNGVSASADLTVVPGPAAQLRLSPTSAELGAGASLPFTATALDGCGHPVAVSPTWSTSSGAGTISTTGEYTAACTPGVHPEAVTARVENLSATASVSISPGAIARLSLSPLSPTLPVGGQQTFSALAADSCGNSLSPSLSWSVGNGGGSIDAQGTFTASTRPGFYADTVQVTAGDKVARTSVTVTAGSLASLEISPSAPHATPGGQLLFTATARDAFGNVLPVTPVWSIENGGGRIFAEGALTADTRAGTYRDTVRAVANGLSATVSLTIEPGEAVRLVLSPPSATLAPGGQVRFSARVEDAHGNLRAESVSWSLADASAGALDSTGTLTATTVAGSHPDAIRAQAAGLSASATLVVRPGALAQLVLTPASIELQVGESHAFSVQGLDANGNEVALSPLWEIVAEGGTVSPGGTFTAGARAGTYPDTLRVSAEGTSVSASVKVKPGPAARVLLSPTEPELEAGASLQFTARAEDAFGNELVTSPRLWSARPEAGGITSTGLFTAGTAPGLHLEAIQVQVGEVTVSTPVRIRDVSAHEPPPAHVSGCSSTGGTLAPMWVLLLVGLSRARRQARPEDAVVASTSGR
ncbi:MAG: right-handed parallel beta-helix repeat-containing protein [Cystobacter sp.]